MTERLSSQSFSHRMVTISVIERLVKVEALHDAGLMDTLRCVFPSTTKIAEAGSPPAKRPRTASDTRAATAASPAPAMACAAYSLADAAALVKDDSLLAEYPAHAFAVCTPARQVIAPLPASSTAGCWQCTRCQASTSCGCRSSAVAPRPRRVARSPPRRLATARTRPPTSWAAAG